MLSMRALRESLTGAFGGDGTVSLIAIAGGGGGGGAGAFIDGSGGGGGGAGALDGGDGFCNYKHV